MFGNDPNGLDPITFWVLLLLSGGQRFSIHELVTLLNRNAENIWIAVQTLRNRGMIEDSRGRFRITHTGIEFLALQGITSAEPEDEPQRDDFIRWIRPPYFSSWTELIIWFAFPCILFIIAFTLSKAVTSGYNFISFDKILIQYTTWVSYFTIIGIYGWLSYYNLMENERLVIFRDGRAVGRRGPGKVLVLPLIYNPIRVDVRDRTNEILREPCITRDNLILNTGFYISWRIENPALSLVRVADLENSMRLLSTAMLRAAIAEFDMQNALSRRRALNTLIRTRISQRANDWGIAINDTEIRELQPTDGVLRQIENRFSATLEGDAALLRSDSHIESLRRFMAIEPGINPRVLTLKYLDTLEKIGEGASTKYIIPMELFTVLQEVLRGQTNGNNNNGNENNPPGQLPGGPLQ